MTITAAQHLLLPGDALLFEGTHPYSRVIERYTNSRYSHVAIVAGVMPNSGFRPDLNRVLIVEALESKGVRIYPLDRYLRECEQEGCKVDWYSLKTPRSIRNQIVAYAISQVGDEYALGQVAWSFLRLPQVLRKLFRLPTYVQKHHWFCSQLASACLAKAEFEIPKMPALMTPEDVSELPYLEFRETLTSAEAA
jgi:hypothetical protein